MLIYYKSNKEIIDVFKSLIETYWTPVIFEQSLKEIPMDINLPLKRIFDYMKSPSYFEQGFTFFSSLNSKVTSVKYFVNSFAYEIFFSYQLKKFSTIERFMNSHSTEMVTSKYWESYDFCLFHFYRGLIFLSRRVNYLLTILAIL